jgi:hypothetical protein
MMKPELIMFTLALCSAAIFGIPRGFAADSAPSAHSAHATHGELMPTQAELPKEPGQSAFAAISEIVALLTANPDTDWSKVNIARLREHLVDMELVTTRALVSSTQSGSSITYLVTGPTRTRLAIQNMVPAHAIELNKVTSWNVETALTDDGAIMTLSPTRESDRTIIQALGFFGIMATGAHHQAHHLAMASGDANAH